jgi:hypothetical protein
MNLFKLAWGVGLLSFAASAACQTTDCDGLARLSLPHTTVVLARGVSAGSFSLPKSGDPDLAHGDAFKSLPAFCRVVLRVTPSADSDINVEVWLPVSGWSRKFLGVGNGGFAGQIEYRALATAVAHGYAAAATDTGHTGNFIDAQWALGHPEKIVDFGYRAIHEMTVQARAIVRAYYATPLADSYFESCSNGGRQALMEAERYPADYDGILAGAPANDWTKLLTTAVNISRALTLNAASYISPAKLPAIQAAVLSACGQQSGTKDGFVNDPQRCRFDPSVLLCSGEESDQCLTQPQLTALRAVYAGTRNAAGAPLFPGYSPGGEVGDDGWSTWILGASPRSSLMYLFGTGYFANMVYSNPQWTYENFAVDQGLTDAGRQTGEILDSANPDLRDFARHGGKLILYHGWSDAAIPPMSTVDYYESVRSTLGAAAEDSFVRLFMVPGMQHCEEGPGPNSFGQNGPSSVAGDDDAQHDIRLALEAWVEKGVAPETLVAAKFAENGGARSIVMTRPLCAYPLVASYKGAGDPNQAGSFVCKQPGK